MHLCTPSASAGEPRAWFTDRHTFEGLAESVSWLARHWEEHGPYDGLFAFSQGACLAAAVCALHEAHKKGTWGLGVGRAWGGARKGGQRGGRDQTNRAPPLLPPPQESTLAR